MDPCRLRRFPRSGHRRGHPVSGSCPDSYHSLDTTRPQRAVRRRRPPLLRGRSSRGLRVRRSAGGVLGLPPRFLDAILQFRSCANRPLTFPSIRSTSSSNDWSLRSRPTPPVVASGTVPSLVGDRLAAVVTHRRREVGVNVANVTAHGWTPP